MSLTYTNPVWPGYFADPFVLLDQGHYYAYGTGTNPSADGQIFPVLHSLDLVHWEPAGGALNPLPGGEEWRYWAPEVAAKDGRYFLYYSVNSGQSDDTHRLRVAVADRPAGPFIDSGNLLLPNEHFSIDAHPFHDPVSGRWYLFFAKDFFDARVGTALAVAPLSDDMLHVTGPVVTILRASADWQIYERQRTLYGKVWDKWHTVEGASVVFHDGRYYCFYSGGCWFTPNYGVGVAVANHVLGPYREEPDLPQASVLRGVPGHVLGPGHNSVVRAPDGVTDVIVYHAWDVEATARRMCIDPLRWTSDGPQCDGPTWTPQKL